MDGFHRDLISARIGHCRHRVGKLAIIQFELEMTAAVDILILSGCHHYTGGVHSLGHTLVNGVNGLRTSQGHHILSYRQRASLAHTVATGLVAGFGNHRCNNSLTYSVAVNLKGIGGQWLSEMFSGHTVGRRFNIPYHRFSCCQRTDSYSAIGIIGNGTWAIQHRIGRFGLHHQGVATLRGHIACATLTVLSGTGEYIYIRIIIICTSRHKLVNIRIGNLLAVAVPAIANVTRTGSRPLAMDSSHLGTLANGVASRNNFSCIKGLVDRQCTGFEC